MDGKMVQDKKEKTTFDVKLEKFVAIAKIKIIKEVRASTNLGIKKLRNWLRRFSSSLNKESLKMKGELWTCHTRDKILINS
ncbi:hypothetical protein LINGRAHAP2_LOCUS21230 [Linum grandiflorum]